MYYKNFFESGAATAEPPQAEPHQNVNKLTKGKISQSSIENINNGFENLKFTLEAIADEINSEFAPSTLNLVDQECRINPAFFARYYKEKEIEKDNRKVESLERNWKNQNDFAIGRQMELLIMILLYNLLKEEFLVVRAAKYDDYCNKTDLLIINKKNGEIIAVNTVIDDNRQKDNFEEKKEEIGKINRNKGVTIKYGVSMTNGKITSLEQKQNVPVFYLGLTAKDLKNMINSFNFHEELSPMQKQIIDCLFSSIYRQIDDNLLFLEKSPFRDKFEKIKETLEMIIPSNSLKIYRELNQQKKKRK